MKDMRMNTTEAEQDRIIAKLPLKAQRRIRAMYCDGCDAPEVWLGGRRHCSGCGGFIDMAPMGVFKDG